MLKYNPEGKFKVCIYARKSSDDKKSGECSSIESQVADCMAVIEREGWELAEGGVYIDKSITGRAWPSGKDYELQAADDELTNEVIRNQPKRKQRRPAFGRMLDDIKAKKVNLVLVRDLTRLARPAFQSTFSVFLPSFFPRHNTSLYSLNDGFIDFSDFSRCITLMLNEAMVDREIRTRSRHSRKAVLERKEAGNYLGGKAIFGYDLVNGDLVPNGDADEVRALFERVGGGGSLSRIAREYRQRGLTTRKGNLWSPNAIRYQCKNPLYAGLTRSPNGLVKCKQVKTPIIAPDLYHAVAAILTRRARNNAENGTLGQSTGSIPSEIRMAV